MSLRTAQLGPTQMSHRCVMIARQARNVRWRTCCPRWNNVVCVSKEEERYRVISHLTLTTATYQWDDLAKCLEMYENAVKCRRGGRSDPLEPSEKQLSEERRRVLRYPGVVAWFTAYKMELFYRHVLRYEDGEGVFEWGAGGILHLHSINIGSCMPRVDPTAAGMQRPDATTAVRLQLDLRRSMRNT